jgi:peptidoglycan/xylan/chitin deacetylase (PgdA/CDA1 family)
MDGALKLFVKTLQKYGCGATFPITTAALARNGRVIEMYQAQNIEFAMHGLFHVDYSQLPLAEQNNHIEQARQVFQQGKIKLTGFRCPYLRWNEDTLAAVADNNLSYDSSQALYWDVVDGYATADYWRVLEFYRAKPASRYPSVPRKAGNLVQIPYCVPDDESLIDRLKLTDMWDMAKIWQGILKQTYELGELFTLGLHPERIGLLYRALDRTLAQASHLSPHVWLARLDEITAWWQARSEAKFEIVAEGDDSYCLSIHGPSQMTVLVRNVAVEPPVEPWWGNFKRLAVTTFRFRAKQRPCIGLSPESDPAMGSFLQQQGYWIETGADRQAYSIYLNFPAFTPEDERPLLKQLEAGQEPLIRLGRWPNAARSALCVTGDIDALTIWDYGLRFLGN